MVTVATIMSLSTGILFIFIALLYWYFIFRFKMKILLLEKRANKTRVSICMGRVVSTKDGDVEVEFKRKPFEPALTIKPRNFKHTLVSGKGQDFIILWSPSPKQHFSVNFNIADGNIKIIDEDDRLWLSTQYRRAVMKFGEKTWMEKYGTYVTMVVMLIGLAIFFKVFLGELAIISDGLGGVSHQLSLVADKLSDVASSQASASPVRPDTAPVV